MVWFKNKHTLDDKLKCIQNIIQRNNLVNNELKAQSEQTVDFKWSTPAGQSE